jgi:serine protease Do
MTRILFRWQLVLGALIAMTLSLVAPVAAHAEPVDLTSAIRAVEPATVRIDTTIEYQGAIGSGTGFVVDPNGAVVTNYHVVAGADTITATVAGRSFTADLVGYDRTRDIAVLQLRGAGGLPTAAIGDSSTLREGEPVVALGNARGSGGPLTNEAGTITGFGRSISAKDELTGSFEQMTGLIEFAAPVRAGDSGGPVVDSSGRVVGVTTAATVNFRMGPGGAGFAIPINDALATANQIRAGVRSESIHIGRPTLLGVGVSTGDQDPSVNGVIVREVIPGGPAQAAGLRNGDVLISLDGAPVDSATTLTNVLDRHYPGDVVDLVWIDRAGQQINGKATLTS